MTTEKPQEHKKIEFNFPLLTVRTRRFSGVFDRLGSLKASRWFSWLSLFLVPLIAAAGLYLIFSNLFILLSTPAAREITRELGVGAYLLLPGVNPYLPILYGWLAIVCAIVVHEGAHGIIARHHGLNVKSSGLLFFLIIPIGAFVDVDEEQLKKAKPKKSLTTLAGGVAGNLAVGLVCLLGILLLVNGLTPIINGVYVAQVTEGMPAEQAGLKPRDIIVSLDDLQINGYQDLEQALEGKQPGDTVQVTVARGEQWSQRYSTPITLTEYEDRAVMGVSLANLNTQEVLNLYRKVTPSTLTLYLIPPSFAQGQYLVPFSNYLAPFYTHSLIPNWQTYANIFFWIWFVNINVAVFNALPIYPFDGGRMLNILLKKHLPPKISKENIPNITYTITAAIISVLILNIIIPYLL